MNWQALNLSLQLGLFTCLILIPISVAIARNLAWKRFRGKNLLQATLALPLILPPTVLGFYLLLAFGNRSPLGRGYEALFGEPLVFSFQGLLLASIIFNIPFAVQPVQRAFEAIPESIREAAWCSGLSHWMTFMKVELPLAWPGLVAAVILTFAHTLGEFGVVLMIGGNIPGVTRVASIAIYDHVESLDYSHAHWLSGALILLSFALLVAVYALNRRIRLLRS